MQLANVDDPQVKTAVMINIIVESVVAVAGVTLLAYQLYGSNLGEMMARKFKHWRNQVFGPPPPTEEQIQHMVKQTHIEATRIVRQADQ